MALSFLDRERTVAKSGFNRWMVPPAALCMHLCIGQAYAFSVFNLPMTKLIGITQSAPGDWKLTELGWIFSIAILFLGLSAAVFGRWVEEGGPRKAMFAAGLCWTVGFLLSAVGVYAHQLWLIYLGYGVLGGIGLGIGYISPVSTLIKWFPDRPGMATGMAIMGFGGGAFIASPLSVWLMQKFSTPTHVGVAETFIALGAHLFRASPGSAPRSYAYRRRAGCPPATRRRSQQQRLITKNDVFVYDALKTPQFWLIWWVLCLNVTAGIGVLGQASAMSQEMFPGKVSAVAAAGFVGLLSLFNMGGRFFWASISDFIGRKSTYFCFFVSAPCSMCWCRRPALMGSVTLFVLCFVVIISMYGGGFATVPAYLKRHVRHPLCRRHPRHAAHRLVGGGHLRAGAGELHPRVPDQSRGRRRHRLTTPPCTSWRACWWSASSATSLVKAVNARHHMKADHEAERASRAVGAVARPAGT